MSKVTKVSIAIDIKKNTELSFDEKITISHACEIICKHCDIKKLNWIQFEFENEEE